MEPRFELPQSPRQLNIFILSVVLTAVLSPWLVALLDKCFPDDRSFQPPANGEVYWDPRSM